MPFRAKITSPDGEDDDFSGITIPESTPAPTTTNSTAVVAEPPKSMGKIPTIEVGAIQWATGTHMMLLGMTGSGKSVFIKQVYQNHVGKGKKFSFAILFGFNADRPQYNYIDKKLRYTDVNPDTIRAKWEAIRKLKEEYFEKYGEDVADRFQVLFIFDDILGENFHKDKFYCDFISRCRHDGIVCIFGIQYINSIPPVIRNNVSQFVITCGTNQIATALLPLTKETNQWAFTKLVNDVELGRPLYLDIRPHLSKDHPRVAYINVPGPDKKRAVVKGQGKGITDEDKEIATQAVSTAAGTAVVDAGEGVAVGEGFCTIL